VKNHYYISRLGEKVELYSFSGLGWDYSFDLFSSKRQPGGLDLRMMSIGTWEGEKYRGYYRLLKEARKAVEVKLGPLTKIKKRG